MADPFFTDTQLTWLAFLFAEIREKHGGYGNVQIKFRAGRISSIGISTEKVFTRDNETFTTEDADTPTSHQEGK